MTNSTEKYAAALDPQVLRGSRSTSTRAAVTVLWDWVPTKDLPVHPMCFAAVMRSPNGISKPLAAALALADDTGYLTWSRDAMSAPSRRWEALPLSGDGHDEIQRNHEERDQLICQILPRCRVDAAEIDLAPAFFDITLLGDKYGRSDRLRKLLRSLRPLAAQASAQHGGEER